MTESLFLMQRYWASDDESDTEHQGSSGKLEKLLERAREKKEKLKGSASSLSNGVATNSVVNGTSNTSFAPRNESGCKGEDNVSITVNSANSDEAVQLSKSSRKKRKRTHTHSDAVDVKKAKKVKFEDEIQDGFEDVQCSTVEDGNKKLPSEGKLKSKKIKSKPNDQAGFDKSDFVAISVKLQEGESSFDENKLKFSERKHENQRMKNVQIDQSCVSKQDFIKDSGKVVKKEGFSGKDKSDEGNIYDQNEEGNEDDQNEEGDEDEQSEKDTEEPAFPIIRDMMNKEHAEVKRILPEWLAKPSIISIDIQNKEKKISELDFLDEHAKRSLQASGIQYLFPVQTAVIPWLLGSHLKRLIVTPSDLCVSAPTGSGKTLSFVIPIVQSLKTRVVSAVRALVVLPVGDLAVQVFKVFEAFCKGTDLQVVLVVGQKPFLKERSSLVRQTTRGYLSLADIVVCTPGRLIDHIDDTPGFNLQKLQYLVIDEADRMMDLIQKGLLKKVENAVYKERDASNCFCFGEESIDHRLSPCPTAVCAFGSIPEPPLQKLLFSATLSQNPEKLHVLSLYRPKLFTTVVDVSNTVSETTTHQEEFIGKYITPKSLTEYSVLCETPIKPLMTSYIIKERQFKKVLCFTQSIEHSHRLYLVLSNMLDFTVRELSSNLKAVQRKIVLQQFELGKIDILVCSDMMARGMDIDNVDCVISYDVPSFIRTYIHRIGRTARAGKDGVTFTLLEKHELPAFKKMLKMAGKEPPSKLNISNSQLAPFEDAFKNALSSSSKIIADEKRSSNISKKTFSKSKPFAKKPFQNHKKRINNNVSNTFRSQTKQ